MQISVKQKAQLINVLDLCLPNISFLTVLHKLVYQHSVGAVDELRRRITNSQLRIKQTVIDETIARPFVCLSVC